MAEMSPWQVSITCADSHALNFSDAIEEEAQSVSFVNLGDDLWRVEAVFPEAPDQERIKDAVAVVATSLGLDVPDVTIERLPPTDWLTATYRAFPPLRRGRFWVYGSHIDAKPLVGTQPIKVDAATAFGTGEHPSTEGCLLALDQLLKRRRFRRVLDMGCGSGILAIAACRADPKAVAVASDIDPAAARLSGANARRNGLRGLRYRWVAGRGYTHPVVAKGGKYDLIFANILARPLTRMAKDLRRNLKPGGIAILAGLVDWQVSMVLSAHRMQGLKLVNQVPVKEWRTLILTC